jgi:signal transduction histidine kinase
LTALGHIIREYAGSAQHGSAIKCDFTIPGNLWDAEVDEAQIGQAIKALVLNAVEAMPGGGTIAITADNIEVSPDELPRLPGGRYVKISVADCGVGIPQELLQTIFDPYVTTRHLGRGLGLTIAYAIIRNHKGHIRVESEPEKGSVFHIYLPALSLSRHSSREGRKDDVDNAAFFD